MAGAECVLTAGRRASETSPATDRTVDTLLIFKRRFSQRYMAGLAWNQPAVWDVKLPALHPSRRASLVPRRLLDMVTTGDYKIWDDLSKAGVQRDTNLVPVC